jgi:hypothetical protein
MDVAIIKGCDLAAYEQTIFKINLDRN